MNARDEDLKAHRLFAIIDEMLRVKSCFEALFADVQSASDLSTLQKLVLTCILDAPAPLTVPQIGRNLGNPRQVVQRIANELEEKGLIRKAENPHHRRALLLVPTPQLQAMRRQAEDRAKSAARDMLRAISVDQCDRLAIDLRALRTSLEAYSSSQSMDGMVSPPPVSVSRAIALL